VVTDYLTQFSGITAPLLEAGPTVTLAQVQAALCEFVSPRDVLVGHSLENDLHALRLVHPTVVDTALIFRARGAKHKHSLRHLALNLLRRQIQPRGGPHCSLEDATAALDLAVRRAVKGPSYARHLVRPQPVNLLTSTFRHHPQHPADTAVCLGPAEWLREHVESRSNVHALTCDSPSHPNRRAAASWLTASSPSRRARLAYVSWRLGGGGGGGEESPTGAGGGGTAAAAVAVASDAGDALSFVRDLRSRVDAATVLCVALQVGFHETSRLAELRKARLNPKATAAWTDQEEERWTRMCNASRDGRVFWILGGQ
jgi:DNA polymerase III epsilon subunit-like protein